MKKLLSLILLCLLFLSSCVSSKTYQNALNELKAKDTNCEDLKKTITEQKSLLKKLENKSIYFLDKLISNLLENDNDEDALEILRNFQKEFPNLILSYHKSKIKDIENIIQAKKAKEEKLKLPAEKRLIEDHDEISGITWYHDSDQPRASNCIYLYIGKKADKKWLRFKIEYSASQWLFIDKYTFKIDNEIENIYVSIDEMKREVSSYGSIYETLDRGVTDSIYDLVSKIANSERTLLRHHGENSISDREITKEEKQSLKTILEAYEKL